MGVGGASFYFNAGLLGCGVLRIVVDGVRSENVRLVSGVPQDSVIGPFAVFSSDLPIILEILLWIMQMGLLC